MIKHLAIIMDGNRRWAKKNSQDFIFGYKKGFESIKTTIKFCIERKIKFLSLYAFSLDNLKRPLIEQQFLFSYIVQEGENCIEEFIKQGIKINFIGDKTEYPDNIKKAAKEIEGQTSFCSTLIINILFCYGSQQEIVYSTKKIISAILSDKIKIEQINSDTIKEYSWMQNIPDPEVIIRTGGSKRLSNFLLFQAAYSEIHFLDCFWPEITEHDLEKVLNEVKNSIKNYGK